MKEEILALEAKLAKLKEKEEEFAESVKEEEEKIESVKRAFGPQQSALDKQQQEVEAREKSLQEECVSSNNGTTVKPVFKRSPLGNDQLIV